MDYNQICDAVATFLKTKHARVTWNDRPSKPTYPFIVYSISNQIPSNPSSDLYLNIDIYEKSGKSVREINDLADAINGDGDEQKGTPPTGLAEKIIDTDDMVLFFHFESREPVDAEDLVSVQLINLRYVIRTYTKK